MIVLIGNSDAIAAVQTGLADDSARYEKLDGDRITEFRFPEETSLAEAVSTVMGALHYHIAPGAKPAWIHSDSKQVTGELARRFGFDLKKDKDKLSRPAGWGHEFVTGKPLAAVATALLQLHLVAFVVMALSLHVKTNAGVDLLCRLLGDTSSNGTGSYAAANYMGLTADDTAPAASNTTMIGEITTGTLARAQATYGHTNGTNVYTLTKSFTSDQAVTVNKVGLFNAASGGTMAFETLLNSPVTLVSGDTVAITKNVVV